MVYNYRAGVIIPFAQKHYKLLIVAVAAMFVSSILAMTLTASAANSTVVVTNSTTSTENEKGQWFFNRDVSNATPIEFNTDQASIGSGSLYVEPLSNSLAAKKFIGEYFLQEEISDVNNISYDFKIGGGGTASDENEFYLNVYANYGSSDPLKFYDCKYDVVPTVGSTTDWTTVTFDPTDSFAVGNVTTRGGSNPSPYQCPAIPADMNNQSPGSTIRMVAINLGDTSLNDADLDGYFDNVVVDLASGVTTFDFEPTLTPETKEDCKNGGWMTFNTPVFKNQGQCVAYVQANPKASFKR